MNMLKSSQLKIELQAFNQAKNNDMKIQLIDFRT